MQTAYNSYDLLELMAKEGNPASVSDAGVGALCAHTSVYGAYLNVIINCKDFNEKEFVSTKMAEADKILADSESRKELVLKTTIEKING